MQHEMGCGRGKKKNRIASARLQPDTLFSIWTKLHNKAWRKHEFNRLNRFLRHPVTDKYISDVSRIGDEELCFDIKSSVLDATFRKLKKLAEREYLHFPTHGVRHWLDYLKSRCDDISQNIWIKIFRFFYKCLLCPWYGGGGELLD